MYIINRNCKQYKILSFTKRQVSSQVSTIVEERKIDIIPVSEKTINNSNTTEVTTNTTSTVVNNDDHLNNLINENARSLQDILAKLQQPRGTPSVIVDNERENISTGFDTVEGIKPVSTEAICDDTLDIISETTKKIRIAAQITTETVGDICKKNGLLVQRTEQATLRLNALVIRADNFIRSFDNPGRMVMYVAFGITTAYTIYNVVRYGQLPMGLLSGALAANVGGAPSSDNHVININYPQSPSIASVQSETSIMNTLFATPYFSMAVVGIIWVLRKVR